MGAGVIAGISLIGPSTMFLYSAGKCLSHPLGDS